METIMETIVRKRPKTSPLVAPIAPPRPPCSEGHPEPKAKPKPKTPLHSARISRSFQNFFAKGSQHRHSAPRARVPARSNQRISNTARWFASAVSPCRKRPSRT